MSDTPMSEEKLRVLLSDYAEAQLHGPELLREVMRLRDDLATARREAATSAAEAQRMRVAVQQKAKLISDTCTNLAAATAADRAVFNTVWTVAGLAADIQSLTDAAALAPAAPQSQPPVAAAE